MRSLVVVALAALLAGCASAPGGLGLDRGGAAPDPYYKEYRELVSGEHHRDFTVPVDGVASAVTVTVALRVRDQGLPLPGAVPATLRVSLLSPNGTVLDSAELDAQHANATLAAQDLEPGRYLARVDGFGASQDLDGRPYGAEYQLAIEVLYG